MDLLSVSYIVAHNIDLHPAREAELRTRGVPFLLSE